MKPLAIFTLRQSHLVSAALIGLMMTAISQVILDTKVQTLASLPDPVVRSADDDRGSGRLANQTDHREFLSFRGSGRIMPDSMESSDSLAFIMDPNYRGSGRLG